MGTSVKQASKVPVLRQLEGSVVDQLSRLAHTYSCGILELLKPCTSSSANLYYQCAFLHSQCSQHAGTRHATRRAVW